MFRILFLLLILLQAFPSLATDSIGLSSPPVVMESSPKSKEIKKIVKQLENPLELEKLIKTLKVLAAAQEKDEKKKKTPIVSYITPIIHFGVDTASMFYDNLKKIPVVIEEFIAYLKIEENRDDLWVALLMWFPILIFLSGIFEAMHFWLFKRAVAGMPDGEKAADLAKNKMNYAAFTLFFPFFYPISFLPLVILKHSVWNWVVSFWVILFLIRILLLLKKGVPEIPASIGEKLSPGWTILRYSGAALGGILFFGGGMALVWCLKNEQDYVLNPIILLFIILYAFCYREWRLKVMPKYLEDSRSLSTVPKKIAPLVNIFIRYVPALFLLVSIPLGIDKILFEGSLWEEHSIECIASLTALVGFIEGRTLIQALAGYKLPKFHTAKLSAFTSHASPLLIPFTRVLQWIWHLSFFLIFLSIWGASFSNLFEDVFTHPMFKTLSTIVMIWGLIYLAWLALDFFVQYHTKPQHIKGKRREPTVFAKTFGPMLHSVAKWLMVLVTIFVTLESFGFDLKILVYLMSAFAFAVSLGSQSLFKDIINGFFALIDGSFAVGEVVTIGAHTGTVESLSLRSITLRHNTGFLQTIPFSEVGNIINKSRNYNVVPIDVATSYKTKIGTVQEALNQTAEDMRQDPTFGKMILEPLNISGIDRFADNAVHVSASIRITPDPNNNFAREFNRRLKIHMDALGITPPIAFQEKWVKST